MSQTLFTSTDVRVRRVSTREDQVNVIISLVQGGKLLFVIDDGSRTPQQVLLTPPNSAKVSDFRWHPVKIEKEGRVVSFVGLNSSSHVLLHQ